MYALAASRSPMDSSTVSTASCTCSTVTDAPYLPASTETTDADAPSGVGRPIAA
jgi:hypothetical protein